MKNRKAIGLFLSIALIVCVVVPGTLAISSDTNDGNGGFTFSDWVKPTSNKETEAPTEATQAPTEGTQAPTEGTQAPTEGTQAPTEGTQAPTEGTQAPTEATQAPTESHLHIDGCTAECDGVDCDCPCHEMGLFDRLMACENFTELLEMIEAASEEELMAFTEDEVYAVEEKIMELEPQPLPEVVIGGENETHDEPVQSEIFYPTVNFDDVAPFGDPVIG